jgi:hypothetical protein
MVIIVTGETMDAVSTGQEVLEKLRTLLVVRRVDVERWAPHLWVVHTSLDKLNILLFWWTKLDLVTL